MNLCRVCTPGVSPEGGGGPFRGPPPLADNFLQKCKKCVENVEKSVKKYIFFCYLTASDEVLSQYIAKKQK